MTLVYYVACTLKSLTKCSIIINHDFYIVMFYYILNSLSKNLNQYDAIIHGDNND